MIRVVVFCAFAQIFMYKDDPRVSIKIAVPRTTTPDERRVAASPETVKKLTGLGCEVRVEKGAGEGASFTDDMFAAAGAKITANAKETCAGADIVTCVQ